MVKKLYITIVSLFIFSFIPSSVWAQNWIFVTSTGNGKYGSYVDIDSISVRGGLKYFDLYHHLKGDKSFKDAPIERLYGNSYVNCHAKTIGYIEVGYEWVGSMEKDKVIVPGSSKVASSMPVRPRSVDEAILEFVCSYTKEE